MLDLPLETLTKEKGMQIGPAIRQYTVVDMDGEGHVKDDYLRIRVDVTKPLRRGVMLKVNRENKAQWFFVCYKRLPSSCYACGLLGHVHEECEALEEVNVEELQYGDWLRWKRDRIICRG